MKLRSMIINILSSGKYSDTVSIREENSEILTKNMLFNSIIFIGLLVCAVFILQNLQFRYYRWDITFMAVLLIVVFFLLRSQVPFVIPALLAVIPFCLLVFTLALNDTSGGSTFFWFCTLPPVSIYLLGLTVGTIAASISFCMLAVLLFVPGFTYYSLTFSIRSLSVYLFLFGIALLYEIMKTQKDKWVRQLNSALKAERDEIVLLRDNLKIGFFMLDKDWVIQPYYSRALTQILDQEELAGLDFSMILGSSLQQKEIETLKDYFTMVLNRSYDAEMLSDINPIQRFTYVTAMGAEKVLQTTFTAIDHENDAVYIMGTIEDRTREVLLEKQLSEEDGRRQQEMKSFFEVVHIDPRVLNDFIEETDDEFYHINAVLKNKELPVQQIVLEMYQGVHAIKSNAIILGLESFAGKLHVLEDVIKTYRDRSDVSLQDVLHLMFELDALMKVNDDLHSIIEKIKAFSVDEQKLQGRQVLIQTLERTIDRLGEDLGKKARLSIKHIDLRGIHSTKRRVIKEVLVQLTRNAMYHGIENPEVRVAYGKNETGTIVLSIDVLEKKGEIKIQLIDDGSGIDFKAIKLRARDHKLMSDPAKLENRNELAKVMFMPGFSTSSSIGMHAGRGVGLSLVHDRIKEAGGTIQLQTEEFKGTVFTIILPYEETETGS